MQTIDLSKIGLTPMTELEIEQTDGGRVYFLSLIGVARAVISATTDAVTGFWDGLKQGFSEGAK